MTAPKNKSLDVLLTCLIFLLIMACGSPASDKEGPHVDSFGPGTDSTPSGEVLPDTRPWIFEQTGSGTSDEPLTKVSVIVDKKVYLVAKSVMGSCNILEKSLWTEYQIPSAAKSACMSWWAGAGDIFYLTQKKNGFQVWHTQIFEGMDLEKEIRYEKALDISDLSK